MRQKEAAFTKESTSKLDTLNQSMSNVEYRLQTLKHYVDNVGAESFVLQSDMVAQIQNNVDQYSALYLTITQM